MIGQEDPAYRFAQLQRAVTAALVSGQYAVVSDLLGFRALAGIPSHETGRFAVDRRDEAVFFRDLRVIEEEVVEGPPRFPPFRRPARIGSVRVGEHVGKRAARKPGDIFELDFHDVTGG